MNIESTGSHLVLNNASVRSKSRPDLPLEAFFKYLKTAKVKPINLNHTVGPAWLHLRDT